MLGHAAGLVTSRYVHHLDDVLIAAADKVAETIWGMMVCVEASQSWVRVDVGAQQLSYLVGNLGRGA